jgi:hypothetical protein
MIVCSSCACQQLAVISEQDLKAEVAQGKLKTDAGPRNRHLNSPDVHAMSPPVSRLQMRNPGIRK